MDINAYISSGIIEQYALGNATPEEASILECVMKNNSEVQKAVLEAQNTLGDLALIQSVAPAEDLKAKIAQKLQFNTTENLLDSDDKIISFENTPINEAKSKTKTLNFFTIAASLLLLLSLGWGILITTSKNSQIEILTKNNEALKNKIDAAEQQNNILISSDKIKLLGVETHPELIATVLFSTDNLVYLQLGNLPQPPSDKQYQLWAIVDGAPVDLGLYDQGSSTQLQPMKPVQNPQAFAITLENKGGSPTPSMEQMYVMGKVG